MTEDNTANLTIDEKLNLVLSELANIKTRLTALETQSSGTTRPLLDKIVVEVIETRERLLEEITTLRREFSVITADVIALRARGDHLERRINTIERSPN